MKTVNGILKSRLVFNARQIIENNTYKDLPQGNVYKYIRIPLYRSIYEMVPRQLKQELVEKLYSITKQKRTKKR